MDQVAATQQKKPTSLTALKTRMKPVEVACVLTGLTRRQSATLTFFTYDFLLPSFVRTQNALFPEILFTHFEFSVRLPLCRV